MKILRIVGIGLGAALALLFLVLLVARFQDGPMGFFPGGPIVAGEHRNPPADWSFVEDVREIQMQLEEPPRSRTTWVLHVSGNAYIPCGAPNFRLLKQWPHQALANGNAVVRIDGKVYEVRLTKVEDDAERRAVGRATGEKYGMSTDAGADPDLFWAFRLEPRA